MRLLAGLACLLACGVSYAQCDATLTWVPPSAYDNGDPLDAATELLEYRLYDGTDIIARPAPGTQSFVAQVGFGTHDFTMTAVALNGVESAMSNTATRECVDNRAPNPPTLLDVIIAWVKSILSRLFA